jgi:hypothetical protein
VPDAIPDPRETENNQGDDTSVRSLTCFVIGPIGSRHAELGSEPRITYEDALEVLESVVEPACKAVGLEAVRADGLSVAGELTDQIFRRLRDDDVVVADLTGGNPNVMYELGLRHTKNKLTVQIGEFGRLPFDVSVIRTVQFSRSRHGLISARNELQQVLETGLAGNFDPVTATRLWSETDDPPPAATGPDTDAIRDEPGLVDRLAGAEEALEFLVAHNQAIATAVETMGEIAQQGVADIAASDARSGGMKGRLNAAVAYATRLATVADELAVAVEEYARAMADVSSGTLAMIEVIEEDPAQLPDVMPWALMIRRLAATARESLASTGGLSESVRENAKLSRVMRDPSNKVTTALARYVEATSQIDGWDRRLQALGVPIPSDDWEPDSEDPQI